MNERSARRLLVLLLVAFVGLGMTYSLAIPVFEAPDEASHLAVVRYFATHRALPPEVVPDHPPATGAEVAQSLAYHDPPLYYAPPLYHALGALLTAWMDADAAHPMSDLPRLVVPSPSWEAGWAPQPDTDPLNKNVYAHRAAEETLARSGTVRAAFALRMLSLALGATTVLCACALARTLWPDRRVLALGAAAIVALNPQFIAVSSGVTNDNLLNALFSLCLVLLVRSMRDGASWWRWSGLGALVGLALLTKQSALLLLPVGLLAIGQQHSTAPRRWSLFIVHCSLFILHPPGFSRERLVVRAQRAALWRPIGFCPTLRRADGIVALWARCRTDGRAFLLGGLWLDARTGRAGGVRRGRSGGIGGARRRWDGRMARWPVLARAGDNPARAGASGDGPRLECAIARALGGSHRRALRQTALPDDRGRRGAGRLGAGAVDTPEGSALGAGRADRPGIRLRRARPLALPATGLCLAAPAGWAAGDGAAGGDRVPERRRAGRLQSARTRPAPRS